MSMRKRFKQKKDSKTNSQAEKREWENSPNKK